MTAETGKQINSINILPDISGSKRNKIIIKFDQLIESNVKRIFKKNNAENKLGKLVRDLFLFFGKILHEVIANGPHLSCSIFWLSST